MSVTVSRKAYYTFFGKTVRTNLRPGELSPGMSNSFETAASDSGLDVQAIVAILGGFIAYCINRCVCEPAAARLSTD